MTRSAVKFGWTVDPSAPELRDQISLRISVTSGEDYYCTYSPSEYTNSFHGALEPCRCNLFVYLETLILNPVIASVQGFFNSTPQITPQQVLKFKRRMNSTWICWGHSNVRSFPPPQSCLCVSAAVPSSRNSTATPLWSNTSHFMAWQDCSRYSFCGGERAEIMCVFTCASVCLCAFATVCLRGCRGAKCGMIAKQRREENRCGGILKTSGDTRAHKHTCSCTLPISYGLLCSSDNRSVSSYVRLLASLEDKTSHCSTVSQRMYCTQVTFSTLAPRKKKKMKPGLNF